MKKLLDSNVVWWLICAMASLNMFFVKGLYDRINTSASTDEIKAVAVKMDGVINRLSRVETRVMDLKEFIEEKSAMNNPPDRFKRAGKYNDGRRRCQRCKVRVDIKSLERIDNVWYCRAHEKKSGRQFPEFFEGPMPL